MPRLTCKLEWLWLTAALGWAIAPASPIAALPGAAEPGLLVEEVSGAALQAAGLQPGDILLAWGRPDPAAAAAPDEAAPTAASGSFSSTFDFRHVQLEEAPRGLVHLQVERQGNRLALAVSRGPWDAVVRPRLSGSQLEALLRGREQIAAGQVAEGIASWSAAREALSSPDDAALRVWWSLRIGEAWSGAGKGTEALAAFTAAVDEAPEASTRVAALEALAGAQERQRDPEGTIATYHRALELREATWGESLEVARGHHQLGNTLWAQGKLADAQAEYQRSLALRERLAPGSLEVAAILNNLGVMAYYSGELEQPAEYYRRALEIREKLDPAGFQGAVLLNNLGLVHYDRGELTVAEGYYRRVLELWDQPAPERRELLASVQDNLGNLAYDRGDLEHAESYHRQALAIWEETAPEGLAIAECLDSIGVVLRARGEYDLAQDFHERGLALRERLGNPTFVASSLTNLGSLAQARGDLVKADEYLSRALDTGGLPKGSLPEASLIGELGLVALERGDRERAEQFLRRTLAQQEKLAPASLHVAQTLTHLARVARARGDGAGAAELLRQALELEEKLAPRGLDHADSLALRAALAADRQEPDAVEWFARATTALEAHLARLGGSHESKAGRRADFADLYRGYIELLLARGERERAFHLLERSRAQAFLALLAERDLTFGPDVPPELEAERRKLAVLYDRTQEMLGDAEGERAEELARELRKLSSEHEALTAKIRAASPRFAALRYPEALDVAGAAAALDPGTVLLAWSLGERTSHLFALTAKGPLTVFELPVGQDELRRDVEAFRALVQDVRAGSPRLPALDAAGRRLYDRLLAPAEERIAGAERLLLLPEGPLHLLPWAALPRPLTSAATSRPDPARYLGAWKPIHLALSASVYAELRRARTDRRRATELAVFADPLYRSVSDTGGAAADPAWLAASTRGCRLDPLPATRDEAEGIVRLWGDEARAFLAAEATEERVKSVGPEVSVLHLAAHGCLDERFPLSSGLALSRPSSAAGGDNGLLQAWEIFESLRLHADLVVLSACDTARGKELAGEGLLGLTRAFHYAGAPSVVASLWEVPDRATAELMVRFHRHLRAGKAKDEALRAAQAELLAGAAGTAASYPYFWAGFQLYGDWK